MTYRETLAHICSLSRFGIMPGLERITALLASLGNPQRELRAITVAGTNGKGSTASFLSSILSSAGYKVGLFTSPHLISFTERIRINDDEISQEAVVDLTARALAVAPPHTTFFELVTSLALQHFSREKVDVAVLETGMGGRLDATNVVNPLISIITPVSLDHCEYLGSTLSAIAREKAGIIRSGRPVVSGYQVPTVMAVLEERAGAGGSPFYAAGREFTASWRGEELDYWGLHGCVTGLVPGLKGRHQAENAACALCAAELLADQGLASAPEAMRNGVAHALWPGRMELFAGTPPIMLDGAHNPAGSQALASSLEDIPHRRLLLVVGVMSDKDVAAILEPLIPLASEVFAVSPAIERSMPSDELALLVRELGMSCISAGSVARGLQLAVEASAADDLLLVCGSLFTVGEARAALLSKNCELVRG